MGHIEFEQLGVQHVSVVGMGLLGGEELAKWVNAHCDHSIAVTITITIAIAITFTIICVVVDSDCPQLFLQLLFSLRLI